MTLGIPGRVCRDALAVLALIALCSAAAAHAATAGLDFAVAINPVARTLRGEGSLTLPPGPVATLTLGRGFAADAVRMNDRELARDTATGRAAWRVDASAKTRVIAIRWSGTLEPLDTALQHRDTLGDLPAASGAAGTFLPAATGWHPMIDGMPASYRITLRLPPGQRGLVPGRLVAETDDATGYRATYEFSPAIDGIDLMAGPYRVEERLVPSIDQRAIRLRTWFPEDLADLAQGYLDSVAGYITLYEQRIGAYPYTGFSVVSSPTPTGFGMPTLTYLGADVIRLPFIRATSLGHEVLHNWWGNGVFPDYATGNWSEGLTTFMADYEYQRREGDAPARAMRLAWLRDFSALPAAGDMPLAAFTSRTHGASQIVGYNKAAMVFSMLRDRIGEPAFDRGLRLFWSAQRFKVASWDDLRRAFEQASERDLAPFFAQWITRPGAPTLQIADARLEQSGAGWTIHVRIVQPTPPFVASVPLRIRTGQGEFTQSVDVSGTDTTTTVTLPADARPLAVELDPDLQVMRRLAPGEAPPILRQVMVAAATGLVVLAPEPPYADAARQLADRIADQPPQPMRADAPLPATPLIVVGTAAQIAVYRDRHALPATAPVPPQRGDARVWMVHACGTDIAFIEAGSAEVLQSLLRGLPHYGGQSWIVFDHGKAVDRGVWPTAPMAYAFPP